MRRHTAGFTLVELLLALIVLGLLLAWAIPAYQGQVARGERARVQGWLAEQVAAQQSLRLAGGDYSRDFSALPPGIAASEIYLGAGGASEARQADSRYRAEIILGEAGEPEGMAVTALGAQAERDPDCQMMALYFLGDRTARNAAERDSSGLCWPG